MEQKVPDGYDDLLSPPGMLANQRSSVVERMSFLLVSLLVVVALALAGIVLDMRAQVAEAKVSTLRTRAVDCRIQLHLSIPLLANCKDPAIAPYFNPNEKVTRTQGALDNLQVICALLRQHGADHPVCTGPP